MQNASGKILYVGKARNLKKRVSSYFQKKLTNARLISLIQQTRHIEIIVTRNESEALLLENQLIKKHKPRYNILLRDDKSFPFIVLSDNPYPRIFVKRGERRGKDVYFGPYPDRQAVSVSMDLIQRIFKLRTCRDTFFKYRTRPCLLYQIHRCSAPCVNYISQQDYAQSVHHAKLLLKGKNQDVVNALIHQMEKAAKEEQYELAANIRDKITRLRHVQTEQVVSTGKGNIDIFVARLLRNIAVVELLMIREGRMVGNQSFYPALPMDYTENEILSAFIPQYYLSYGVPDEIVIKEKLPEQAILKNMLTQLRGKSVKITIATREERKQWIAIAEDTANQAIATKLASDNHYQNRLKHLQEVLHLSFLPKKLECFDISHSSGEATVASCVVFDEHGPLKKAYRRFNITNITPGDDYGALRDALMRRYTHLKKEKIALPDILFIDGGKGQLTQAQEILKLLEINTIILIAVAKGITRKPGLEQLFLPGQKTPLILPEDAQALHLIQHIRDEAHRFAITSHRRKRDKTRRCSILESIPGVGPKKRQELLRQLGGMQEVKRASVDVLQKVPGINKALAEKIYKALNG